MLPLTERARARALLLDELTAAGLEVERLDAAGASRAEAARLRDLGERVAAGRDALSALSERLGAASLDPAALTALGAAARATGCAVGPCREALERARELASLERELATLSRDRGLLARARTKPARRRIEARRRAVKEEPDDALGRALVLGGWLDLLRGAGLDGAVEAALERLPAEARELGEVRARLQEDLALPSPPTALDLRPLLSRTRASEGAAREAAEGAETEAIEAVLARSGELPGSIQAAAEALVRARDAEHGRQRVALEAQLEAIEAAGDEA